MCNMEIVRMVIHVRPEEAKSVLDRLDDLLQVYQLSRAIELIEGIKPYWDGQKADDFTRKINAFQDQLSTNIAQAKKFHTQAKSYVEDLLRLDENA